jgi:hypothetical protein
MNQTAEKNSTKQVAQISQEIVGALADAFGRSSQTIERWIEKKDIRLSTDERAKQVFARKGVSWDGEAIVVK